MISGFMQITPSDISQSSTTKNGVILGNRAIARDGTFYRWTQAGASGINIGLNTGSVARVANHSNLAVVSNTPVNALKVTVTLAGTAVTQDQYADGTLIVNDGAGVGQDLLIVGNSAQASTTGNVDVYLAEPIGVALTSASSKVTLQPNQNAAVTTAAASAATVSAGFTPVPVAANAYFWAQTRGQSSVLSDGVIAKNTGAIASTTVAGAVTTEAATTVTQRIGFVTDATVDTKYYSVFLLVD